MRKEEWSREKESEREREREREKSTDLKRMRQEWTGLGGVHAQHNTQARPT